MRKNINIELAFAKHTPSAFIVGSPFQLLCAIEAIHEFEIEEYRIAVVVERNNRRLDQLRAMAEYYHLDYDLYWAGEDIRDFYTKTGVFANSEKQIYPRIFVGDYYIPMYNIYSAIYAAKNAIMVYMDDGNSTVLCLKGMSNLTKPTNWRKRLNWYRNKYERKRGVLNALEKEKIYDSRCFFTIYSDVKTKRYKLYKNTLSHVTRLASPAEKKQTNLILIVGAPITVYADEVFRINESIIEAAHWTILSRIRNQYPNDQILFIPHGRDNNKAVSQFCENLDIEYRKIDEPIETYILRNAISPLVIYGFESSALANFHVIYPSAKILTLSMKIASEKEDEISKTIRAYYKSIGIEEEVVLLPPVKREGYMLELKRNVLSLIKLIRDKLTGYKYAKK